jgi:hypothetical protein
MGGYRHAYDEDQQQTAQLSERGTVCVSALGAHQRWWQRILWL